MKKTIIALALAFCLYSGAAAGDMPAGGKCGQPNCLSATGDMPTGTKTDPPKPAIEAFISDIRDILADIFG